MTRGRRTVVIVASTIILGGIAGVLLISERYEPSFSRDDPDYRYFAEAFARLEQRLANAELSNQDAIDLSHLNGGDWTVACVFGGYNNPLQEMQALGATVGKADQDHWTEAGSRGLRVSQVEEFEIAVAYIDRQNRAHFLHFDRGIGSPGQHLRKCISKPDTMLVLAGP